MPAITRHFRGSQGKELEEIIAENRIKALCKKKRSKVFKPRGNHYNRKLKFKKNETYPVQFIEVSTGKLIDQYVTLETLPIRCTVKKPQLNL